MATGQNPALLFPDADSYDVILRTNPRPAERTHDITKIWGGELVFEGIEMNRDETP